MERYGSGRRRSRLERPCRYSPSFPTEAIDVDAYDCDADDDTSMTTSGHVQGVVDDNTEEAHVEGEEVRTAAEISADSHSESSTAVSMIRGRHSILCEVKYKAACRQAKSLHMPGSYTYVRGVFVDVRPWERSPFKAELMRRQAHHSRYINPHGTHAMHNGVFVDLYPCPACYGELANYA